MDETPGELQLAQAAAQGDPVAVRVIDSDYLTRIDAVVRNIDTNDSFLDEVRQVLRVNLLVATGKPPRIASYQGRGPLLAWIRVAAIRVAIDLKRVRRNATSDEDVLADLVAREPDPELQHLETIYRAEFGRALREALAALPERSRVVLRLHFVEGVTLARIGSLYRVHESTVSRWLQKATEDVAADAQVRLRERLALSPQTFNSLARLLRSGLDLSISRLLGEAEGGARS
jgi:RNA polymerase sigma-70 factor, ECF subfamily